LGKVGRLQEEGNKKQLKKINAMRTKTLYRCDAQKIDISRFPYDHNASLDANLQTVNEKLNNMEEYREELQEAEYSGGMRR
jgi:uncharacterized membrane protein (DUF106 family)